MIRRLASVRKAVLSGLRPLVRTTVVDVTGGLGNQILSVAALLHLRACGERVEADLRYFGSGREDEIVLDSGLSIWPWDLERFGMRLTDFDDWRLPPVRRALASRITDGPRKLELAIAGLEHAAIREAFDEPTIHDPWVQGFLVDDRPFAAIHLRRGDYVRIGAQIIPLEAIIVSGFLAETAVDRLVVVTDSPLGRGEAEMLASIDMDVRIREGGDPICTHTLLRRASVLFCSNSQFSLSAALLSVDRGARYIPSSWFDLDAEPPARRRDLAAIEDILVACPSLQTF